jgi:hypothetical protein
VRELKRLLVVERITDRGRDKMRPPWFSKEVAFRSLRDAMDACPGRVELHLVVDHGLPPGVEELLRPEDHVHHTDTGSSRGSMVALFKLVRELRPTDSDFVWFAEDDYLYHPQALNKLVSAAEQTGAEYFSLHRPDDVSWHRDHPSQPLGRVEPYPGEPLLVEGESWSRITHTNSTFGGWADFVLQDLRLFVTCTNGGSPYDHSTNLVMQGVAPFPWRHLFRDLNPKRQPSTWIGPIARPPMRVLLNVMAQRRGNRTRSLLAPVRELACHMEVAQIRPSYDWPAIAHALAERDPVREGPAQ